MLPHRPHTLQNEPYFCMSKPVVDKINRDVLAIIRESNPDRYVLATGGGEPGIKIITPPVRRANGPAPQRSNDPPTLNPASSPLSRPSHQFRCRMNGHPFSLASYMDVYGTVYLCDKDTLWFIQGLCPSYDWGIRLVAWVCCTDGWSPLQHLIVEVSNCRGIGARYTLILFCV